MNIDLATAGPIGLLIGAISTLWAWHISTVKKKDDDIKEAHREIKELAQKVVAVVESNTKATIEQREALEANQKASEAVYNMLTEYVLKSAGN